MNNNIIPPPTQELFDKEHVELIRRMVAINATDDEFQIFLHHCKKTGLDPLAKQIYFQKRLNKKTNTWTMTIITGIDGYRLIAHRTGVYAGLDPTLFQENERFEIVSATVTVFRLVGGIRCPFSATARWAQYCPQEPSFIWNKMPHLMLEKCAEALALRKAFPAELSGVYTEEEMQQADDAAPEATKEIPALNLSTQTISVPQAKRLFAIAKSNNWDDHSIKDLFKNYSYNSSKEITLEDYDNICADLQKK